MTVLFPIFKSVVLFSCLINGIQGKLLKTNIGILQGEKALSENGNSYLAFKKVPYGQPPVDQLRFEVSLTVDYCLWIFNGFRFFQPPEPVESFKDVYDTTSFPEPCAQAGLGYDEGAEDCLYMSIYAPNVGKNLNAMIGFIYLFFCRQIWRIYLF